MKVKEIKKTIEQVVNTQYIAEDGEIFYTKEECEKYEQSALFVLSKSLNRIDDGNVSQYGLIGEGYDDTYIEIFNIQNDDELEKLKRYLYLKIQQNGSYSNIDDMIKDMKLTSGHEIIIFFNYDFDYCWCKGDGSLNAFLENVKTRYNNIINPKEDK